MRFRLIFIVVIFMIYGFLIFLNWESEHIITQKWTITVDTPNGIVKGSSNTTLVRSIQKEPFSDKTKRTITGLYGEIPYIRLNANKFLFALVLYKPILPTQIYAQQFQIDQYDDLVIKLMTTSTQIINLHNDQVPIFFTFDDINDPKTLREIDESQLSQYFGEGYKFQSISLQLTNEKPTQGSIYKALPWLRGYKDYFNYYYAHSTKNRELMKAMHRLDIERRQNCTIDPHIMRILTLGYHQGIGCVML